MENIPIEDKIDLYLSEGVKWDFVKNVGSKVGSALTSSINQGWNEFMRQRAMKLRELGDTEDKERLLKIKNKEKRIEKMRKSADYHKKQFLEYIFRIEEELNDTSLITNQE